MAQVTIAGLQLQHNAKPVGEREDDVEDDEEEKEDDEEDDSTEEGEWQDKENEQRGGPSIDEEWCFFPADRLFTTSISSSSMSLSGSVWWSS